MDFNFDALESVNRANPIKHRVQTWRLKRTSPTAGPKFTFSQSLFDELNMTNNSLDIMHDPEAVYLVVCSDNDGKWARKSLKGNKGKGFKNEELAKLLDERGLTETRLDVASIGVNPSNNRAYYRIIAFVGDTADAQEADLAADDVAAEMGNSPEPVADEAPQPESADIDAGESVSNDDF